MPVRRLIEIKGTVQGVGFRPFVHRLALSYDLSGFVQNSATGVLIDVEGEREPVHQFCSALTASPPPLASIARVDVSDALPLRRSDFHIAPSSAVEPGASLLIVPPDVATCESCVAELFDIDNRRFGHAFISCTDCGPRFTIIESMPYDRERTVMSPFDLCDDCRHEYNDPGNRRFHTEAIACRVCGPVLFAKISGQNEVCAEGQQAIDLAAAMLRSGSIVAIKALGGFHLACDAANESAVTRLRDGKHRPAKPFAVMVRDVATAGTLCELSGRELGVLTSLARPVVLLQARSNFGIAASVAPGSKMIGLMLPSTPLHHLLLAEFDGPLVMTSGNHQDEPVVIANDDAESTLSGTADLFLMHDRAVAQRVDDSVVRVVAGESRTMRRARGFTPKAIATPVRARETVLAVGGHLKNSVCVANNGVLHLSPHIGDLESFLACNALRDSVQNLLRMTGVHPTVIAHDLHPDYASTRFGETFAQAHDITRRIAVQHHHAHVAACVAEYGVSVPVIGVVFDGAGLGTDGAIWGGEFLVVSGARFTRRGHLAYVPLPGGDAAARAPWRAAAAHVARAGISPQLAERTRPTAVGDSEWRLVQQLIHRNDTVQTSSVGRLFDAISSLIGLHQVSQFEGQAAMALESLAGNRAAVGYPVTLSADECWTVNADGVIDGVIRDVEHSRDSAEIAAAFHASLRDIIVLGCNRVRDETDVDTVVLSGGVFANALLTTITKQALVMDDFRVLVPRLIPCNDGGLALGQAYIATCALAEELCA